MLVRAWIIDTHGLAHVAVNAACRRRTTPSTSDALLTTACAPADASSSAGEMPLVTPMTEPKLAAKPAPMSRSAESPTMAASWGSTPKRSQIFISGSAEGFGASPSSPQTLALTRSRTSWCFKKASANTRSSLVSMPTSTPAARKSSNSGRSGVSAAPQPAEGGSSLKNLRNSVAISASNLAARISAISLFVAVMKTLREPKCWVRGS
mmetsp:Transcript_137477/g.439263  ORF Transcript_137477/g.439263 Transcript_137477/m.439263 type:complete len:208 (-) Transcript_137477:257-880(-)